MQQLHFPKHAKMSPIDIERTRELTEIFSPNSLFVLGGSWTCLKAFFTMMDLGVEATSCWGGSTREQLHKQKINKKKLSRQIGQVDHTHARWLLQKEETGRTHNDKATQSTISRRKQNID